MENICHRYLNLPFSIAKPDIDYSVYEKWGNFDLNYKHQDENIQSWFSDLGLTCGKIEVFYTPPGGCLPIHADDYDEKKRRPEDHVKINITFGPEEATLRFWESKKTFFLQDPSMDCLSRLTLAADEKDCKMIQEVNTNTPSLINSSILHSTYNPTDEGRWTLCFVPCMRGRVIPFSNALKVFDEFIVK
jgi:hypothetical protein